MKFLVFYKKKIIVLTRIKFITYKIQPLIKFLTNLFFTFKASSGLSVGSTILYFLSLTRLPFNIKTVFFKLNSKNKFGVSPTLNFNFLPKLNNKFWFIKIFFLVKKHEKLITENFFLKTLTSGLQFVRSTPQQTFLGFSGQLFDGARFSETHHNFFLQITKSKISEYSRYTKNFSTQYNALLLSKISLDSFVESEYSKYNFTFSIFNDLLKY